MEAMRKSGETIIPTPVWVLVVRIAQIVLSLIVLGISGWWIHGLYANPVGFAIVCCVFTWIISLYNIISEKVTAAHHLYNTWAVLALDGLMIIFWLSAMGAVAAYRGRFTIDVQVTDCYNDGSLVNSGHCTIVKRAGGVAGKGILNALSGSAGVSAIIMLLFVASFAYVCHHFRLAHAANKANDPEKPNPTTAGITPGVAPGMDPTQANPLLGVQQQQQPYPGQPQQPQQTAGYPHQYPQAQEMAGTQQQPYDPYIQQQQNTAYTGAGGAYMPPNQNQQQYQQQPYQQPYQQQQYQQPQQPMYSPTGTPAPGQQQVYSPHGTPAPGQPYEATTH